MTMSRRLECKSEGCTNEVLQILDSAFDDRRGGGGRSPLSPNGRGSSPGLHHRHSSNSILVSKYCKQHTCAHFLGDERCLYKKPPHDSVCAIHAKCPVPNCNQARAQVLDPNFDPLSGAIPRYVRFDVCHDHKCALQRCQGRRISPRTPFCQAHACHAEGCPNQRQEQRNCCVDHQCKTRGCRTIVEGEFPHCAIHIKCQVNGCGEARHFLAKANDYLAYCTGHATCSARRCNAMKVEGSPFCYDHTCRERGCNKPTESAQYCEDHRCAEPDCQYPRSFGPEREAGKFCPMHTCRASKCQEYVGRLALYCSCHGCCKPKCHHVAIAEMLCIDHFKDHYISHGKRQLSTTTTTPRNRTTHGTTKPTSPTLDSDSESDRDDDDHTEHPTTINHNPNPNRRTTRLRSQEAVPEGSSDDNNDDDDNSNDDKFQSSRGRRTAKPPLLKNMLRAAAKQRRADYTEPGAAAPAPLGGGSGGGGGGAATADEDGRPSLFVQIPPPPATAPSGFLGGGNGNGGGREGKESIGRQFQGRRAEVEDGEEERVSDGW
ncbi:hypothetical protein VTI74DRAFT_7947 [Chaetomium olivicolor]